jgi:LacI family transcriptional regulator
MSEIAAAAGVSVPTVSKVVNGRPDVASATRSTVEALLHKHGYPPARNRTESRRGLIELVFVDLGGPWAMAILAGVEEVAAQAGTGVVVSTIAGQQENRPDEHWLERVIARRSDGLLLALSEPSESQHARLDALGMPVVVVDPVGNPRPGSRSVGATNWNGGLAAAEHLIELGHRRIAVISGPTGLLCSRARVDGYRAAMGAAGLAVPTAYLRTGDFRSGSGYDQTMALLNQKQPPTAIFVCSDRMALGAYEALHARGLRIPDDISIVGFDDLDEARWAGPPLTTVRQPLREMAGMATRMLLGLINGEEPETTRVELATPLIVRSSTGPRRR